MQSRVTKLEAIMATVATREDLSGLEVKLYREISEIHRDVIGIHRDINRIHQAVDAQTWRIISTLIGASTALVVATYCLVNNN